MGSQVVEEWLSTGEAAAVLGTTRQHIVDLCKRGDLPYIVVGSHRRVLKSDVEWLRQSRNRLTADQRRSIRVGHALAGQIVLDPEAARRLARENLERQRMAHPRGKAQQWFSRWEQLLDGPLDDILQVLTSNSVPVNRELRQNNPFAGLLTDDQRERVITAARQR
jgi:excisionase family DNA binding protein